MSVTYSEFALLGQRVALEELTLRKLKKYFPVKPSRRLEDVYNAFKKAVKNAIDGRILVLVGATGVGKTEFLVALSMYLAKKGEKVVYVTKGKNNRLELTIRIASVVKKMLERGEKPPNILVLFSRYDTCPNKALLEKIEKEIRAVEKTEKESYKYMMFYSMCNELRKKRQCIFHLNAMKLVEKIKKDNIIPHKPILLSRKPHVKIPEPYRSAIGKEFLDEVDFVEDFKEFSSNPKISVYGGICSFDLIPELIKHYDIVVIDHWHITLLGLMKYLREELKHSVLILDEFHEIPTVFTLKINVKRIPKLYQKIGLNVEAKKIEKRLRSLVEKMNLTQLDDYTRFGTAVKPLSRDKFLELFTGITDPEKLLKLFEGKDIPIRYLVDVRKLYVLSRTYTSLAIGVSGQNYYVTGIVHIPRINGSAIRILSSATASKYDVWNIIAVNDARKIEKAITIIPSKYPRKTIVVYDVDSNYYNRKRVVKLIEIIAKKSRVAEERDVYKVIIASSGWWSYIKEVLGEENVYFLPVGRINVSEREKVREEVERQRLLGNWIVMSPHSWAATGINLVNPARELRGLVVVLGENTPKPTVEQMALVKFLAERYRNDYAFAVYVVNIRRGVIRTLQAIGRWQRSRKHFLEVWFIGKHFLYQVDEDVFNGLLKWYRYEELYGPVKLIKQQELEGK